MAVRVRVWLRVRGCGCEGVAEGVWLRVRGCGCEGEGVAEGEVWL